MATIRIEGMDFFAYHGCFTEESIIGTRFEVDLTIKLILHKQKQVTICTIQ
jgi:dihydroneopterin aldolase